MNITGKIINDLKKKAKYEQIVFGCKLASPDGISKLGLWQLCSCKFLSDYILFQT